MERGSRRMILQEQIYNKIVNMILINNIKGSINMKRLFIIIMIYGCSYFISAQNVITLPEINKPRTIQIFDNQIFITENVKISIYSAKTQKLIRSFGKRGEGPGEFKIMDNAEAGLGVQISIKSDFILANSIGKITYFDRNGKYVKEVNTHRSRGPYGSNFIPVGKNFVAYDFVYEGQTGYVTISLFGPDLSKIKDLYKHPFFVQRGKKTNPEIWRPTVYYVSGNQIFLDLQNGAIEIYNSQANNERSIKPQYPLVKESAGRVKAYLDFLKSDPRFRDQFHLIKDSLEFPRYLPLIRFFNLDKNYIYVLTNEQKEGKNRIYILDYNGKIIRSIWTPLQNKSPIEPYPYVICNETIYQIVENPDTDEWELHIRKL